MVKFCNKKEGFSLAESLVVMLILSVFLAASSKVITQKKEEPQVSNQHGQFECWKSGSHYYKHIIDGVISETVTGTSCKFKPRVNAAIYHLYVIYGNKNGYYMESIPNITSELSITLNNNTTTLTNSDNKTLTYDKNKSEHLAGTYEDIIKYLKYVSPKSSTIGDFVKIGKPAVLIIW